MNTWQNFFALATPADLPVGTRLRILPNHVCMMAAPYDRYHVVEGGEAVVDEWDKRRGW